MKINILSSTIVVLVTAACQRGPRLETRTFDVQHLYGSDAEAIVMPYVYQDRPGAPGMLSVGSGTVTVRETPDNLARIERVLAEHDVPRPDLRLHFQLIEADGFTDSDPAIADVEAELRKIFQFGGYRLVGEAVVTASDDADISQSIRTSDSLVEWYEIGGHLWRSQPDAVRIENVTLEGRGVTLLQTTVSLPPGQTLVLGSSPKPTGSSATTLLLTVRAEEVDGSGR